MLRAVGITRGFVAQPLFESVDWFIGDRDRIGLIGPNGSGKSTWLKMLVGEERPDSGRIEAPKGQRVGYLPQFAFEVGEGSVREEARAAFSSVLELKESLESIERELNQPEVDPKRAETLLDRYGRLEEEFRHQDGYDIDRQIDRVLRGLGFALSDFDRPVAALSGGWQMRVALAKLLLERPDVLLLDEPTNHLDIEAREWLEGFLREYPGSFVVVSHDRYFLDVTVSRITDIMMRKLVDYTGNYSRYLERREERYAHAIKAYERQQEEIRRITRFIDRFRAKNTKATQVQSRIKMLQKMDRLEKPVAPERSVKFNFPSPDRSGRITLELGGVQKSYGDLTVFTCVDLRIERGQKVALVGPNGAGKSTLMRILAGTEPIQSGRRILGSNVSFDHFAQDAADRLPAERSILELAMDRAPVEFVPQVRGLLGAFLFSGQTVDKRVSVLSGGERNRLALALLLMRPANLLLLDEPTNHLDMAAKDVLLHALERFAGTVVFVSHDRYFLDRLADRVLEVGGGGIYDYPGGYEGFLHQKRMIAERAQARSVPAGVPDRLVDESITPTGSGSRRKGSVWSLRRLEEKIENLESRKKKLGTILASGEIYKDPEKSSFYLREFEEVSANLESAVEEWSELTERLGES